MKIYASSKGLAPKAGFDNTTVFNRMIENASDKTTVDVTGGKFFFNGSPVIDKTIYLECKEDTIFDFGGTKNGMIIKGGYKNKISNLTLWNHNYPKEPATGEPGLIVNAVTHLDNVTVRGFGGNGFHFSADIEHGSGKDTSGSTVRNCAAIENGGDGYLTKGGDANNIGFFSCDARDNKGWGFNEDSFLGGSYFSCMAHASGKGHYKATAENNRTTFAGCYAEGDSPKNWLAGDATWTGGIAANDFILNDRAFVRIGNRMTTAQCGDVKITPTGFEFAHTTGSFPLQFQKVDRAWPYYVYRNQFEIIQHIFTAGMGFEADYEKRPVPFSSMAVPHFFLGVTFMGAGKPDDAKFNGFTFKYGDTLLNPDYTGEGVRQWVYKKSGWEAQN